MKMELGFLETLRRRRKVLGVDADDPDDVGPSNSSHVDDIGMGDGMSSALVAEKIVDETEAAQKQVMSGAVVKIVIDKATEGTYLFTLLS